MELSRNFLISIGLDRLYGDILRTALANRGWRLLDTPPPGASPGGAEPEIVLVAGSGSAQDVIDRLRRVRDQHPSAKVVLLGPEGADADMVRFIEEGASGYVLSSEGMAELLDVLQMVRNNRTPSSGRITQLVLGAIRRLSHPPSPPESRLTTREQEIFRLIQDGLSNKEIAGRLHIAPNTVKNHVHHLLEKLKVRNRHEAAWLRGMPSRSASPEARTGTEE